MVRYILLNVLTRWCLSVCLPVCPYVGCRCGRMGMQVRSTCWSLGMRHHGLAACELFAGAEWWPGRSSATVRCWSVWKCLAANTRCFTSAAVVQRRSVPGLPIRAFLRGSPCCVKHVVSYETVTLDETPFSPPLVVRGGSNRKGIISRRPLVPFGWPPVCLSFSPFPRGRFVSHLSVWLESWGRADAVDLA